jgi:hypothetical protein
MNILCIESFCSQKTHNKALLFGSTLFKHGRYFDCWNQPLIMRKRLLRRLSWSWTVLLPSDTHKKSITSITAVLLPFVIYLLTLPRIWNDPEEGYDVDWFLLVRGKNQWQAFVNTLMNFGFNKGLTSNCRILKKDPAPFISVIPMLYVISPDHLSNGCSAPRFLTLCVAQQPFQFMSFYLNIFYAFIK